jgi:ribose 5-phosphate isomerase A
VIVDNTKLVSSIGHSKLPVEVLFYGHPATRHHMEKLGYIGNWRLTSDNTPYLTENGNLLFDIQFPSPPLSPESEHEKLIHIPGVLETGFFFHLAHQVIIGYADGHTELS